MPSEESLLDSLPFDRLRQGKCSTNTGKRISYGRLYPGATVRLPSAFAIIQGLPTNLHCTRLRLAAIQSPMESFRHYNTRGPRLPGTALLSRLCIESTSAALGVQTKQHGRRSLRGSAFPGRAWERGQLVKPDGRRGRGTCRRGGRR